MAPENSNKSIATTKRTKRNKQLWFYGYVVAHDWLTHYGLENGLVPTPPYDVPPGDVIDLEGTIRRYARDHILVKARLVGRARFCAYPIKGVHKTCLVLTTNEKNPYYRILPKERYAKLKEVLGTDDDPMWWPVEYRG